MPRVEDTQAAALKLLQQGYVPLRLDPDSKAARHNGWQVETPTEESVRRQFARPSNLGVRCGDLHKDGTVLIGIDVDLEEGELIRCVQRAIGDENVPVKKGKKGATYIFRLDREQKTTKLKWVRDKTKKDAIDILCKGAQTVVPPSIHPDTQLPYQYIAGPKLEDTDYRSLPVFGPSVIDEIAGFCKNPDDPIYALNDMVWAGVGGGGNTHDTCVRAVSCMVGRQWTDEDIHQRIQRAKREACEAGGVPYNWPEAHRAIQEWIDSSREKKFDTTSRAGRSKIGDIPIELINNYVYIAQLDRMYSLANGMMLGKNVFDNIHARELEKPWASLVCHPDFRVVDRLTYSPGHPQICQERSFNSDCVHSCLNIYRSSGIEPEDGDVGPFKELMEHVFDGDADAVHHVTSFFAYMVQNPGQRINHALVIQGEQGIGKDTILAAISEVIGHHNYSQVTLQHVESQFNDWLFGKQLIVFQEMMAAGRRGIYNKLKTFITEPQVSINEKHLSLQRLPNRAVYVFLTNYKHAISIDHGDRRMWVWYSKAGEKPEAFFRQFNDWKSNRQNISALLHYLLGYDTSKFKPYAAPPMTHAKKELIQNSASEIEQFLRSAIDQGSWPMGCDLVNVPHLHSAIRPFMRVSLSVLQEALDHLGCRKLETRPKLGGVRLSVWAVRDWEKWKDQAGPPLAKAYRIPLPPQQGETEGTYSVYQGADISSGTVEEQF